MNSTLHDWCLCMGSGLVIGGVCAESEANNGRYLRVNIWRTVCVAGKGVVIGVCVDIGGFGKGALEINTCARDILYMLYQ